jgi:hypothetical protein
MCSCALVPSVRACDKKISGRAAVRLCKRACDKKNGDRRGGVMTAHAVLKRQPFRQVLQLHVRCPLFPSAGSCTRC